MPKHLVRGSHRRWTLTLASLLLALPLAACGARQGARGSQARPYRVAVIPKGMTHEFWRTIHAGAIRAQRDLAEKGVHVELVWKGPLREDDREQQVQVVESFASQGIDGIVLAPLDDGRYGVVYVLLQDRDNVEPGPATLDLVNVAAIMTFYDPATGSSGGGGLMFALSPSLALDLNAMFHTVSFGNAKVDGTEIPDSKASGTALQIRAGINFKLGGQ